MSNVSKSILVAALICSVFCGTEAFAARGTLIGVVADKSTGEPLSGAAIVIEGTRLGALADEDGTYRVARVPVGTYSVTASMVGYKPVTEDEVTIQTNETSTVNFQLLPVPFQLGEIVVTGTKTPHLLKDVPVATSVITKKEIEKSGIATVAGALSEFTGVEVTSGLAGGTGLDHRVKHNIHGLWSGFGAGYCLILVDGEKIKDWHNGDQVYLNQLPVKTIERIEVVRGPSSVLYGSSAISGVVNVITKRGTDRPTLGVSMSYGRFDTFDGSMSFGSRIGKAKYMLSIGKAGSDGLETWRFMCHTMSYDRETILGNLEYDITDDHKLTLKAQVRNWERWGDPSGFYKEPMPSEDVHLSARWDGKLGADTEVMVRGYRDRLDCTSESSEEQIWGIWGDEETWNAEAQISRWIGKKQRGILGIVGEYYDVPAKSLFTKSVFVQDEIYPIEPLTLVAGIRIDVPEDYGTQYSPKGSMLWRITDRTDLRVSVGRSYLAPTVNQLYRELRYFRGLWMKGNSELSAEKSVGYTLDIDQRFGERILGRLELFRYTIKDKIESRFTGEVKDGKNVFQYANIGKVHSQGVEVQVKVRPADWATAEVGYTYVDLKDDITDKALSGTKHRPYFRVVLEQTSLGLRGTVKGEFKGNRYVDRYDLHLKDYFKMDCNISKKLSEQVNAFLSVENVLNERYEARYVPGETMFRHPGRMVTGGLSADF